MRPTSSTCRPPRTCAPRSESPAPTASRRSTTRSPRRPARRSSTPTATAYDAYRQLLADGRREGGRAQRPAGRPVHRVLLDGQRAQPDELRVAAQQRDRPAARSGATPRRSRSCWSRAHAASRTPRSSRTPAPRRSARRSWSRRILQWLATFVVATAGFVVGVNAAGAKVYKTDVGKVRISIRLDYPGNVVRVSVPQATRYAATLHPFRAPIEWRARTVTLNRARTRAWPGTATRWRSAGRCSTARTRWCARRARSFFWGVGRRADRRRGGGAPVHRVLRRPDLAAPDRRVRRGAAPDSGRRSLPDRRLGARPDRRGARGTARGPRPGPAPASERRRPAGRRSCAPGARRCGSTAAPATLCASSSPIASPPATIGTISSEPQPSSRRISTSAGSAPASETSTWWASSVSITRRVSGYSVEQVALAGARERRPGQRLDDPDAAVVGRDQHPVGVELGGDQRQHVGQVVAGR